MVIKMSFAAIFMLLCGFTSVASYTPSYTIVAPKMIKPGIKYLFSLMTKGGKDVEFVLEASIRAGSGPILVNGTFNLKTNVAKVLTLQIPNVLPDSSYTFFVSASQGVNFSNSSQLAVNRKVHSIFIQTDKVLYKPGQKILFRVIAINPDLKPYNGKMNVTIFDTASNKILKLVDQQNENVLPKFEIKVELPSYFLYNVNKPYLQKNLQVSVIAKYTYGQPVKGTARVEIKLKQWWYSEQQPKITKFVQLIDGKGDFSLTVSELKTLLLVTQPWSTLDWQVISVEANVTETETGILLSGKNDVTCRTQRFQLEFLANTPDNYKPGLMFYGYLSLKFIDGSLPSLSDIQNSDGSFKSISIKSTTSYNSLSPRFTNQEKEKKFTSPLLENGYAILIFNTSEKSDSLNFEASFNDEETNTSVMVYKYVTKFQTRDKGGIQITLKSTENIIKPSTILQFQVKTVNPIKDFQFQILAKGLIVAGNQVKSVDSHTEHTFAVSVTAELAVKMAPEARFVVSYVTPDGELIADSLAIPVVDYFANKISLSFSKNQTEPGDENVYLNVKTKTNSFVGLLAVDQSVLLLRSGNDITQDVVKSELSTYSEVSGDRGFPVPMGIARRKRCIGCWLPIWLGGSDTSAVIDVSC
ncbi:hypothetical protein HELRODRAFT_191784 [Helobdella robusta]|uniref:Alpha-2-macroglobulin bait region domain-containing protein n=1 Tax=Helobdella robusta TaxID=6412 RepID=T1FTB5_HELRO|nr:hypothetical protein HELRODRAFT_191784 [Helobdella robusta]ESO03844.1 hypothetical protein HELRODRAFT_191784 [Helobdella robusta]